MSSNEDSQNVVFLQWVLPRLGLRWLGYRKVRKQVAKRIRRRVEELDLVTLAAYRDYIETHPDELAAVARACRVTISRFYRDRAMFDRLFGEVLPRLAEGAISRGEQELRVWNAGCACGEEAYTVAIGWRLSVAHRFPGVAISIFATDVDEEVIERARRGCYRMSSLRECPAVWQPVAFRREGELACVAERFRDGVSFRVQDLRTAAPEGRFHLVLCRNLAFTYFDLAAQRETAARIVARLVPGGVLMLGGSEALPAETPGLTPGAGRGFHVKR